MTTRLPLRIRAGVAALAVLALLAVGGATAAVQVGAAAIEVGGGFTVTTASGPTTWWAGYEVRNRSALPITLHSVQPRVRRNAEILDARVTDSADDHILLMSGPLPQDVRAIVERSRPLDGFVLPPNSGTRFQIVVRFRQRSSTAQSVLARTAITYSVLGLDHGAISDGVYCVRALGAKGCAPR